MKFNVEEFKKLSKKDFETAWLKGVEILPKSKPFSGYPLKGISLGEEHPVFRTINMLRTAYLMLGFKETINPLIVDDSHIYRQFGKEAPAILDRCFYLAGLPRPNVGISEGKIKEMENIAGRKFNTKEINNSKEIFHKYKRGEIDADDLAHELSHALGIDDTVAVEIMDVVFPEFKKIEPMSSNLTLRSHMTTGWFLTLQNLHNRLPHPIKLFSIDRCFRREQREDETRLTTYFSASCVVVDENVTVDDGKAIAEALLSNFGFEKFKFRPDEKRSKYYIPGTQTEVFAYHPGLKGTENEWVEIATFGIYSPTALAQYDINTPVLNLGLGVERLTMVLEKARDVRALVFPQFYSEISFSDMELARMLKMERSPSTPEGYEITRSIAETCEKFGNEESPCEFVAREGELYGKRYRVKILEKEDGTRLCGPAYLNEIVIHRGNILGIPRNEKWKNHFEEGVATGIRYIDGFALKCGAIFEELIARGENGTIRSKMVEGLGDINLKIDDAGLRYITGNNRKIDVRGPLFITAELELL